MLNLPVGLLKMFCIEWIEIEEISRLDRALCESTKRKIFMNEVLNRMKLFGLSNCFSFPWKMGNNLRDYENYNFTLNIFLQWIKKRNIFIKILVLTSFHVLTENFYNFPYLRELIIDLKYDRNSDKNFDDLHFRMFLKSCVNLEELTIKNCDNFKQINLESTLSCLENKNISFFSVKNCNNFDDNCNLSIRLLCEFN
jgi:hypothetical protein